LDIPVQTDPPIPEQTEPLQHLILDANSGYK
jgi:hypothetical protein